MTTEQDDSSELEQDDVEIKRLTKEFVDRLMNVDNEIETLKDDRKALISEYKKKLDMPTLAKAMRVAKIKSQVLHRDTFDTFMEVLEDPAS